MGVGLQIRRAMEATGKLPVDIARHLGITESAVSQWFAKDSGPKRDRLSELAAFLNTTVEWLLADGGNLPSRREERTAYPDPAAMAEIPLVVSTRLASGRPRSPKVEGSVNAMRIASIDQDQLEFSHDDETHDATLELVAIDTDGQEHPLVFEKTALIQLDRFLRALRRKFPGSDIFGH